MNTWINICDGFTMNYAKKGMPFIVKQVWNVFERIYIKETLNRSVDIINEKEFASASRMLKTMMHGMWLSSRGQSHAYCAIKDRDMKLIYDLKINKEYLFIHVKKFKIL